MVPPVRHLLRAKDLADARYAEPLTVADLARAARLSPAHFSREFRRTFGESPHQYLLTRRLERAAALLRNTSGGGGRLVVELRGKGNRHPVGARLRATVGDRTLVREVVGGGSYLAASDRRVFLGLGPARVLDRLEVRWPSGRVEVWRDLPACPALRLEEGTAPVP